MEAQAKFEATLHPVSRKLLLLVSAAWLMLYVVWGFAYTLIFPDLPWHLVISIMYLMYGLTLATHWAGHRRFSGWFACCLEQWLTRVQVVQSASNRTSHGRLPSVQVPVRRLHERETGQQYRVLPFDDSWATFDELAARLLDCARCLIRAHA